MVFIFFQYSNLLAVLNVSFIVLFNYLLQYTRLQSDNEENSMIASRKFINIKLQNVQH